MDDPRCLQCIHLLLDAGARARALVARVKSFNGPAGGALFRAYPGPWQVYRRLPNMEMVRVQSQDSMPTLKQVALEILPMA